MIDFTKSYYALIDNKITDKEPVGYCYCDAHKGYISAAYCKSHNCLHKDKGHICTFFIQNKEHQYFMMLMLTIESLIAVLSFGLSCFGLGYIGNKTQKK